ncbi:DUF6716 putative glycosyltransferase [Cyanobium sp. NIES-981]|uniref:DUF6716 putative glycosyltransferase n=1 Tax=Cyanobium sp. NIES-981 TaxID=1851505 RepID=UPI0007DE1B7C|nr:DUF6716 putative glycosyltransferase [Cyanobium sp. NIES-981]SBO44576.1 conserved protein of unknown function [Cyanobium sp. NIES-981]
MRPIRVLLVADTALASSACGRLAAALRHRGVEVFEEAPLDLDDLSVSDLLTHLDAVGLFAAPECLPRFLRRLRQACALRGGRSVAVFSGPTTPLVGDALTADLLPRLGVDLLCLHGPRQQEELDDLLRTSGHPAPASVLLGPWGQSGSSPPEASPDPNGLPRRLVFLEQQRLPPAPGARERLLTVLERLCANSPGWELILQADPFCHPAPAAGTEEDGPAMSALLQGRASHRSLRAAPPEIWRQSLRSAGVCATISSPLLWQTLALGLPLLLLGDYGIRTDMDGPLLFGSGLMGRLAGCDSLEELRDLPAPNPEWLRQMGWTIRPDAGPLVRWLAARADRGPQAGAER